MPPSRLRRPRTKYRLERETILRRLGAVKGSLFLLASLPDAEAEPPARQEGDRARGFAEEAPIRPK